VTVVYVKILKFANIGSSFLLEGIPVLLEPGIFFHA
jgi:hypothetical protein